MLSAIDPFHVDAAGARLPDESMYPAVPYNLSLRSTATTNANGSLAFYVTPQPSRSFNGPTTLVPANGTVTWSPVTSTAVTNYSSIITSYEMFRHVNWGVRITAQSAISVTAGTLYIGYVPNDYSNSVLPINLPSTPDQILALPWSAMYPASELNTDPIILPAKRIDPGSQRFRDYAYPSAAPTQVEVSDGWGTFVFILTGANGSSATSLQVEVVYRTEAVPNAASSVVSSGTTYPTNTSTMDAVSNVSSAMPLSYVENDDPTFIQSMIAEASARATAMWHGNKAMLASALVAGTFRVGGAVGSNWIRSAWRGNSAAPLRLRQGP